jgi:hypothetical protein
MPQSYSQKTVNNFVKGLITEAGELTFPEGASVDELNCDLRKDGSRRRRLGVAYEESAVLSSFTVGDNDVVNTGDWTNAGGLANKEFLIIQVGGTLHFYNKASLPYSSAQESFTVNLSSYEFSGSIGAGNAKCSFTSLKGFLLVSSEAIDTFYVSYNSNTNTITHTGYAINVRDFSWQGDTSTYTSDLGSNGATPAVRQYDAKNSGWGVGGGPNELFRPLTHPWFAGKDADGNYSYTEWAQIYAGSSILSNGHFVLNFFAKDRSGVSGIAGIPVEYESSRFKSVVAFSGRIFYGGLNSAANSGTILFSKLIENQNDFGTCYQVNDPTAEYLSDLLDTDGGSVRIADAVGIKVLYAFKTSLFVFAENGVWQITGVDGVFTASTYSINRVSTVGIASPSSFLAVEGVPVWWSRFGIHTLNFDQVSGSAQEQSISQPTIQTFWDRLSTNVKENVVAQYDGIAKKAYWFYPDADETITSKLNNALILDIPLQAFYPWRIEDQATNTNCVVGSAFYSGYGSEDLTLDVVISTGDDVVLSTGDDVVSIIPRPYTSGDATIILLARDGATNKLTMAGFNSTDFVDWGDTEYTSFAEAGYDFMGDLVTKKNAPYLAVYTRLTEEGFELTGGSYTSIRPSSLLVSTAWDFKNFFAAPQQAYRLKYPVIVNVNDLSEFPYPEDVIVTKLKIRGHGRSVRLRYESEVGKDFILLGWGMVQAGNKRF